MHRKVVDVWNMFEGVLLEIEPDNVVRCVRVVGREDTSNLLLEFLLRQLQLVVWLHQRLGLR